MTFPIIHLNGSNGPTLLNAYIESAQAVMAALDCLCAQASPNARDYYPKGNEYVTLAMREHESRVNKLKLVHNELMIIVSHIEAQLETQIGSISRP